MDDEVKKPDDYYYKKLVSINEARSRSVPVKVLITRVPRFATYYDCGKCNRSIYILNEVDKTEKGLSNSKYCPHCGQLLEDNWYSESNE